MAKHPPRLRENQGAISLAGHEIRLSAEREEELAGLIELVAAQGHEPPALGELTERGYSKELIYAAGHLGRLIPLANEHWTTPPEILDSTLAVLFRKKPSKANSNWLPSATVFPPAANLPWPFWNILICSKSRYAKGTSGLRPNAPPKKN